MKILIADDSKTSLAFIAAALKKLNHEVVPVNNGLEAIQALETVKPDLIILDVMMEGLDGFECAKKIRKKLGADWIPIIFLSGSVDDYSIEKGINAGGDDYLTKPFSDVTLAAKIKAMQRIANMRNKLYQTTKDLAILSSIDSLTGLYNRHQFEKTLAEKISEADRYHNLITLMFVDIDYFKHINDTLGHYVGDLILKVVANRLKENFRLEDFIARLGGDEFVIILTHMNEVNTVEMVAKKIIKEIAMPIELKGKTIKITCSIGIAFYPSEGVTQENFLENADIAMYHAKECGRNNYQYFNDEIHKNYIRQVELEEQLKYAIEKGQLKLLYQPIVHLINKNIYGMEALLIWENEQLGRITSDVFIPIAEKSGIIHELIAWMLEHIMRQIHRWNLNGYANFMVFIKLSLQQIIQFSLDDLILKFIDKYEIKAKLLVLEICETKMLDYTEMIESNIKRIHDLGINIAIPDLGIGYSTLATLKYLPVNVLKIHKSFLDNVTINKKNNIIVKTLINLALSLDLILVAEGINTNEQLDFILSNGCKLCQGDFISKSLDSEEMTNYLSNND